VLDVAVQASFSENLGGTIESLLMECPTVATRTGGLVDSIRDGATGVLVEPLDPGDLANGVLKLLHDPANAHRMAANGRKLMLTEFTLKTTVDALDDLYRRQHAARAGPSGGYRPVASLLRMALAVPVFAYLVARLAWDTKFLSRWDTGWRPFPIPQIKAIGRGARSAGGAAAQFIRQSAQSIFIGLRRGPVGVAQSRRIGTAAPPYT